MPNSINSLSPDLRDFLLNRNIISDTILSSGLDTLLQGIGLPTEVYHSPESVQPSESIEDDGVFYKDLNVIINKYQGTDDDYEKVSINYLPGNTNSTWAGAPFSHESYKAGVAQLFDYTSTSVPANGPFQGGNIREFTTAKNNYLDVSKQTKIDFNSQPVPAYQIGSYLDEYGFLNVGGPDTQPLDIIGSVLGGGGVGFDPNGGGLVPDFDVRASLAGRVLNAAGLINDTLLGQISASYLASAIGNNIAFNVQQETIGSINLNPLSLLSGNDIIVPNYNITVAKGTLGTILDLGERMLGFETPVSLLGPGSSIFSSENPVGNIERLDSMVNNTGKGQVLALIANLDQNKYKPLINDGRKKQGTAPTGDNGTNPELYAFGNGDGTVQDLLNTPPISISSNNQPQINGIVNPAFLSDISNAADESKFENNHGKITSELNGRFNEDFDEIPEDNFNWVDNNLNKERKDKVSEFDSQFGTSSEVGNEFSFKKTILSKTQQLFKTNKMKTLVSGREDTKAIRSQIQSGVRGVGQPGGESLSKGSGVLSKKALEGDDLTEGDNVFCRTWSSTIQYDEVGDLVRHSGLKKNLMINPNANVDASVLDKQGFVQIGPYNDTKGPNGENVENYMFSIENLAYYGSDILDSLPDCEKGPGDPSTGRNGRIMWFPPYDISFNETTSVSLERNNFIGRGEPIYTYNNTERMGTLSWKIIIDHPNYMNFFPSDWKDDEIASFYAGCLEDEEIVKKVFTSNEINEIELAEKPIIKEVVDEAEPGKIEFTIYFKNDETDIPTLYENGLKNGSDDPTGYIEDTDIMGCYETKLNAEGTALECIAGYGLGTTKGEGIVGGKGTVYNDRTNFGLNGQGTLDTEISFEGKTHRGWMDADFIPNLTNYISNKCKYCKITIEGYASSQGASSKNQKLSTKRANNVKSWLISNVVPKDDEVAPEKRVVISEPTGKGETETGCTGKGGQDRGACKLGRKTVVTIKYDAELKPTPPPIVEKKVEPPIQSKQNLDLNPSRFFKECDYFTRLKETSPTAFKSIKEKIPFFHPSFHSTTPEGFNSRLTFLQQCTRQGPSLSSDKTQPSNLAFGRPPVCILRIGDFYHTKIMMESLTIDYDPLVWDLNPEGVGVQPMIANVTISFVFIGGSSLKGPINKLQNAVSFNYFANTELYDVRADIVKNDGTVGNYIDEAADSEKEKEKNEQPIVEDQEEVLEEVIAEEPPEPEESADRKILDKLEYYITNGNDGNDGQGDTIFMAWLGTGDERLDYNKLTKPYTIKLETSANNNGWVDVFISEIIPNESNKHTSTTNGWPVYYFNEGYIKQNGLIPIQFRVTIEVPNEPNIYYKANYSVASTSCAKAGVEGGRIISDEEGFLAIKAFKKAFITNTCNPI